MPKFRIHHAAGNGRAVQSDVVSGETQGEAVALFSRHNPRLCVRKVEALEPAPPPSAAPGRPPRTVVTLTAEDRPMTEADWEAGLRGLAELKEQIRHVAAPPKVERRRPGLPIKQSNG